MCAAMYLAWLVLTIAGFWAAGRVVTYCKRLHKDRYAETED